MKKLIHLLLLFFVGVNSVMLMRKCSTDEIHRSCSFYNEYTCWEDDTRLERVRLLPKRLVHCKAGCFCKKGLVRAYPGGRCIAAAVQCRDKKLQSFMMSLPKDFSGFM